MKEKILEIADRIHDIYQSQTSNIYQTEEGGFIKLSRKDEEHILDLLEILVVNAKLEQLKKDK